MTAKRFVQVSFACFLFLVAGLCGATTAPESAVGLVCLGLPALALWPFLVLSFDMDEWVASVYVVAVVWIWGLGSALGLTIAGGL